MEIKREIICQTFLVERVRNKRDEGFTLIEIIVALLLFVLFSTMAIPIGLRFIAWQRLSETTDLLTNRLRLAQSESLCAGNATMIEFAPYQPHYSLRTVSRIEENYGFSPGVTYKDNYLQLNTNRVTYGLNGNSEVSGVVRLVDESDEQDIKLYMGGLCEKAGVLP
jgi:prepilin-type N-terminal cleavage/methylation domain-containing protein